MNLYLQHNESATSSELVFYLANIENSSGIEDETSLIGYAGAFETDVPYKRIDYIFPNQIQKIIKTDNISINLYASVSGNVEITPTLIIKIPVIDEVGQIIYEERDLAKGNLIKKGSNNEATPNFRWNFTLNESYALAKSDLILRLDIVSLLNADFTATASNNIFTSTGISFNPTERLRLSDFDEKLRINGLIPSSNADYYIVGQVGDTFSLSDSIGGTPIDVTADGSGTITAYSFITFLERESKVVADIVEGEEQNIDIFTESKFKIFQKRERMFFYSEVDALEDVMYLDADTERRVRNKEIPRPKSSIFTTVESKEYVNIDLFSHINVMEDVTNIYPIEGTIKGPFTENDSYITEVEIEDFSLPTWDVNNYYLDGNGISRVEVGSQYEQFKLRKKESLHDIVERLAIIPPIVHPPNIPDYPKENNIYKNVANKFLETVEMIKAADKSRKNTGSIETVESTREYFELPGGNFKVFIPNVNLTSVDYIIRNKELQLKYGYDNISYPLTTTLDPLKQASISSTPFTADSIQDTFLSSKMPFVNGTKVRIIDSNIQIGGLSVNSDIPYYIVQRDFDIYKLSLDKEGTQIVNVTTSGKGTLNSYVPVDADEVPVNEGNSLWLLLRHKPVGASISTRFRQQPGRLVLQKKVTSTEEVRVWRWDNVIKEPGSPYFDTHIDVTNPLRQRPGFAGKTVAMMLV